MALWDIARVMEAVGLGKVLTTPQPLKVSLNSTLSCSDPLSSDNTPNQSSLNPPRTAR